MLKYRNDTVDSDHQDFQGQPDNWQLHYSLVINRHEKTMKCYGRNLLQSRDLPDTSIRSPCCLPEWCLRMRDGLDWTQVAVIDWLTFWMPLSGRNRCHTGSVQVQRAGSSLIKDAVEGRNFWLEIYYELEEGEGGEPGNKARIGDYPLKKVFTPPPKCPLLQTKLFDQSLIPQPNLN